LGSGVETSIGAGVSRQATVDSTVDGISAINASIRIATVRASILRGPRGPALRADLLIAGIAGTGDGALDLDTHTVVTAIDVRASWATFTAHRHITGVTFAFHRP
jgi:hypothetical protein